MRFTILSGMLVGLAATFVAMPAAQARDYPVCLRVYLNYHDWYDECSYDTMAQCRMSASGRAADCMTNPWYKGPEPRKKPRRQPRKRD
ncbi:DUF3551 domain-containing protein [Rhodopseudomonas sp. HC1]|uniref:DUF3551 domain-containing protein n=1 Tax=Rhodopseudomonas infernalis TaxID=2897386 RepID=UPI001EE95A1D|nr:DUF3551 domain-containing protein [Rhodopseudomonas infernalis]MCG6206907.1 DUF3551 domain-containing protein [Rhodopseudomonas infernalis]